MAFTRNGYGQVEPNQLSAQKTGQIYASLPLDSAVNVLQNGEFMFYDYKSGKVTATAGTAHAEPMLVFNEIKLYEEPYRTTYKDFAMIRVGDNYVTSAKATEAYGDGSTTTGASITGHTEYPYRMDGIAPRVFKTNVGDIMTTNMVALLTGEAVYAVGDILAPVKDITSNTLVLTKVDTDDIADDTGMQWVVAKVYTMPDGQPGLKLQRVQ